MSTELGPVSGRIEVAAHEHLRNSEVANQEYVEAEIYALHHFRSGKEGRTSSLQLTISLRSDFIQLDKSGVEELIRKLEAWKKLAEND